VNDERRSIDILCSSEKHATPSLEKCHHGAKIRLTLYIFMIHIERRLLPHERFTHDIGHQRKILLTSSPKVKCNNSFTIANIHSLHRQSTRTTGTRHPAEHEVNIHYFETWVFDIRFTIRSRTMAYGAAWRLVVGERDIKSVRRLCCTIGH